MAWITINANDKVRVKLTDRGREVHRAEYDHMEAFYGASPPFKYSPPEEDPNGWSEWQLWRLMELFGPHTHLGMDACFETTMQIERASIRDPEPA